MPLFNSDLLVNVDYHPGFKSGNYYLHTPFVQTINSTSANVEANSLIYTPLFIPKRITIDRLAMRTASNVAGSLFRFGIYNNSSNGLPSNLLVDAGEMSSATLGFKEGVINCALNIGWYWLAVNSFTTKPSITAASTFFGSTHFLGFASPLSTSSIYSYWQSGVSYGALPSNAPVSNLVENTTLPLYWFRVA